MGTTATLTARFVATVTPAETRREYFDRVVTGLALRVAPTGTKSWVLLYRQGRRLRRWTLGRYPTLSLADARDRARAGLRTAAAGDDPAQAKRTQRDALTVGELAERYLVEYAPAPEAELEGRSTPPDTRRAPELAASGRPATFSAPTRARWCRPSRRVAPPLRRTASARCCTRCSGSRSRTRSSRRIRLRTFSAPVSSAGAIGC